MKRFFTFIAVIAIIPCHAYARSYSKEAYESLCRLDRTLDDAQTYEKFKQEHIEFLKTRLTSCTDRESTYRILDELYEEYNKYDLDSTLRYASLKLDVAKECENRFLMDDATLDVADIYIMSGMYHEAFDITEQSDINRLESSGLLPRYYHLMNLWWFCPCCRRTFLEE
ncbi:MAG: hypothetical protein E7111_01615 [Bacteroidales bacterium]|nr:hypothetical protein [Bacteroidales bacterium]